MSSSDLPSRVLTFDTRIHRLLSVKKAAYRHGDRCFIGIRASGEHEVEVTLQAKSGAYDIDQLSGDFRNEVTDQDLREVIREETAAVRNLLLAQAFSATSLVDQAGETGNDRDDPLNIRERNAGLMPAPTLDPPQ